MMLSEQELGFEQASPGIVVLPAEWPVGAPLADYLPVAEAGARDRGHAQPARLPLDLRHGPRGRGGGRGCRWRRRPSPSRPPAARRPTQSIAVEIADPDLCAALRRARRARRHGRPVAGLAQGAPHARRHAAHQQRGRRHQLRACWPSASRCTPSTPPTSAAASSSCAAPAAASASSPSTASTAPCAPDNLVIADTERALVIAGVFGAIDAEVDDAHHRPRARGGHLQRPQHHAHLQRGGLAQRGQLRASRRASTPATCRSAWPWRAACSTSSAAAPWRPARSTSGAQRPAGAAAPALPPEPLRRPARPAHRRPPSRPTSCAAWSARSTTAAGVAAAPPKPTWPSRRRRFAATSSARSTWSKRSAASTASSNLPETLPLRGEAVGALTGRPAGARAVSPTP